MNDTTHRQGTIHLVPSAPIPPDLYVRIRPFADRAGVPPAPDMALRLLEEAVEHREAADRARLAETLQPVLCRAGACPHLGECPDRQR